MTLNELYKKGCTMLTDASVEDACFDAKCLIEHTFRISATDFFLKRSDEISEEHEEIFLGYIKQRINGIPLQYIIGKWEFMSDEFFVGDGVLIPRPETEMLVELATDFLKDKKNPVVVDLCSGSGCIAISIAKLFPEAKVYAVEKYDSAFSYLLKNIEHNCVTENCFAIKGDLFDKAVLDGISPDLIVSNPPYIRTDDIATLDIAVRNEPHTALDGGDDGYDFYRFLSEFWFGQYLKDGSLMLLECGEDQGTCISEMLRRYTDEVRVIYDFNNLQRVVTAKK